MEPNIYCAAAHHIRKRNIDRDALMVMDRLLNAGYLSYLVGGSVRDLLMGQTPKDFDISTSARPEEVRRLFRNCLLIGRRFRLAHLRFGRKIIEVSTFRSGDTEEDSLIVRDNCFGSPEEDVLRRDFTLNGLFYSSDNDTVIDYVNGYRDLSCRLLRTIGNAETRFKQDPVRMLRLLKFRARFHLAVDSDTWRALLNCRNEILKSSSARLLEELFKMLESGSSNPFFRLMASTQLLDLLMPSLAEFLQQDEQMQTFAYLSQLDRLVAFYRRRPPDRSLLVACLFYPMIASKIQQKTLHRQGDFNEIAMLVEELFESLVYNSFVSFPKRIRATVTFLINAQFRLTPADEKKPYRSRIIHHPEFFLALQLLFLRSQVHPHLKKHYHYWCELLDKSHHHKRRRRDSSVEEFFECL